MTRFSIYCCLWMLFLVGQFSCTGISFAQTASSDSVASDQKTEPANRHFELIYSGSVNDLDKIDEGSMVRVWLPIAQTTSHQQIVKATAELPDGAIEATESVHGNKMYYFEYNVDDSNESKTLPFTVRYEIKRSEVNGLAQANEGEGNRAIELDEKERKRYLMANALVPIDGKPLDLLDGVEMPSDQIAAARELYDRVEGHMAYDKTNPGYGNGDVLWACDSKTGNCTDFHSLFISFARSRKMPAHFEIGFPLPPERGEGKIGGYHCWAQFFVDGKGWIPVDISEADKHPELKEYYFGNLTENRVSFTKGRDIVLNPKQDGEPLNYFVYPYVEVDGKVWPKESISLDFQFKDLNNKDLEDEK